MSVGADDEAQTRFRVLLVASSSVRIMTRPRDAPGHWRFQTVTGNSTVETVIRDVVQVENDIPWHRGFEFQVDLPAASATEAGDKSIVEAEKTLIMLSAAGRAPTGSALPMLAYDITPEREEREFAQWYRSFPLPDAKRPISVDSFGPLYNAMFVDGPGTRDERLVGRLFMSFSWHRLALNETDALTRFLVLWLAFEAVGPLLAEHYGVDPQGFGGLRSLADEEMGPEGSSFVTSLLDIRRRLFHVLRVSVPETRARAQAALPELERLLLAAWTRLLNLGGVTFPPTSLIAYPTVAVVRAVLFQRDASVWRHGYHPHLEGTFEPRRNPTDDPEEVAVSFDMNFTVRNVERAQVRSMELYGADRTSE